jgi:hypothetical protein
MTLTGQSFRSEPCFAGMATDFFDGGLKLAVIRRQLCNMAIALLPFMPELISPRSKLRRRK